MDDTLLRISFRADFTDTNTRRSSVDIEEGQWVRVTEDVISGGINMKGSTLSLTCEPLLLGIFTLCLPSPHTRDCWGWE